jgi:hypothetical protein
MAAVTAMVNQNRTAMGSLRNNKTSVAPSSASALATAITRRVPAPRMASASFRRLSYGAGAHVILLSQCAEWGTFSSMGSKNLAVEAVISELVSARLFPVLPGKYSEIRRILPVDDNGAPPSGCKFNRLAPEFPKH